MNHIKSIKCPFVQKLCSELPNYLSLYLLTAGFDSEEALLRISFTDPHSSYHISKIEAFVQDYVSHLESKDLSAFYAQSDYSNLKAKMVKILPGHIVRLEQFQNSFKHQTKSASQVEQAENSPDIEQMEFVEIPNRFKTTLETIIAPEMDLSFKTSSKLTNDSSLKRTFQCNKISDNEEKVDNSVVKRKRVRRRSKKKNDLSAISMNESAAIQVEPNPVQDNSEQTVRPISRVKFSDDGEVESICYMDSNELENLSKSHNRRQMKKSGKFAVGSVKTSWDKKDADYIKSDSQFLDDESRIDLSTVSLQEENLRDVDLDGENMSSLTQDLSADQGGASSSSAVTSQSLADLTDYSKYKDFIGEPSVGMKIAFKMIVLNEERFEPETSDFITGSIQSINEKTKICCIKVIGCKAGVHVSPDESITMHWGSLLGTKCLGTVDSPNNNEENLTEQ